MNADAHLPVMLQEAIASLQPVDDGQYLDATFGRGGHTRALLEVLGTEGRVLAIDQDLSAARVAHDLQAIDARFSFFHGNFADLDAALQEAGMTSLAGALFDLGVSSPQLDDASRGFSFRQDGPLDMRMDQSRGQSAADWLARAPEQEIADVIWRYGEERYSRRMARAIVAARRQEPLVSTRQLAEVVAAAHPRWPRDHHPATRAFQAIRIHVNGELRVLPQALAAAFKRLAPGGRLVVISFHSLEDRLVKQFMRDASTPPPLPRGVPLADSVTSMPGRLVARKLKASASEMATNPRARSAVLRVLEKVA